MGTKDIHILTVNAGSSSIKIVVFSVNPEKSMPERFIEASISAIGQPTSTFTTRLFPADKQTQTVSVDDQNAAASMLMNWLTGAMTGQTIDAIGHRVVHGGPNYSQPTLITNEVIEELRGFTNFDPEHMPFALELIEGLGRHYVGIPQVACFDTAFFHDLPRVATLLPIPREYQAEGLRRYGFHGLSYTYLQSAFRDIAGDVAADGNVIYAHLGSGASLAATSHSKPVDTTMGFTPASGIMMSSRSGDIDPGIVWYLEQKHGLSGQDFNTMVNFKSGLLGVSGLSADMHSLLEQEATNEAAADAVNLFVRQVRKAIGALTATLGGLDSLVFSGGIGEQSSIIRSRICEDLGFLGITVSDEQNNAQARLISDTASRVGVHVIPTDEAQVITTQVLATLHNFTPENGEGS